MRPARRALLALATLAVLALASLVLLAWRGRFSPRAQGQLAVVRARLRSWQAGYVVRRDVPYVRDGAWTGRLDLYLPRSAAAPSPVVVLFHGGGWVEGSKEQASVLATRFAALGYAVANVEYRLASQAPAPAAVEDARCAVRWIGANAGRLRLDSSRVVTAGGSAGGHLALMAGLLEPGDGFDRNCMGASAPAVAAIINLYGPTALAELRRDPAARGFTDRWLAGDTTLSTCRRLSPVTYVRRGAPFVVTIHGADDRLVPVDQAYLLQRALDSLGVANVLRVLPATGHDLSPVVQDSLLTIARRLTATNGTPEPRQ